MNEGCDDTIKRYIHDYRIEKPSETTKLNWF